MDEMTEYERGVHAQRVDKFRQFYTDVRRIDSIAIYEGYIGEDPSQERPGGHHAPRSRGVWQIKRKGPLDAFLRIGTPKNLLDSYETYKKQKRQTTQQITLELETDVQNIIAAIGLTRVHLD